MMDLTKYTAESLLDWKQGNKYATHVLCEMMHGDACIYKVLSAGNETHCEGGIHYYVDGVKEEHPDRFVREWVAGHVVGEQYYCGTDDKDFRPVHPTRFVGRLYIGGNS